MEKTKYTKCVGGKWIYLSQGECDQIDIEKERQNRLMRKALGPDFDSRYKAGMKKIQDNSPQPGKAK